MLGGHSQKKKGSSATDPALAMKAAAAVPRKYAESKNHHWFFKPCFSNQGHTRCNEAGVRRWNDTMTDDPTKAVAEAAGQPRKPLTPAAPRALAEAEVRRQQAAAEAKARPKEVQGPKGLEPTRYGDWERKGIASDF
jgi:hypothetical protein